MADGFIDMPPGFPPSGRQPGRHAGPRADAESEARPAGATVAQSQSQSQSPVVTPSPRAHAPLQSEAVAEATDPDATTGMRRGALPPHPAGEDSDWDTTPAAASAVYTAYAVANGELPDLPSLDPQVLPPVGGRLAAGHAGASWRLQAADGHVISVTATTVVGRNPSPDASPGAVLAPIADDTKTVSKTHARFIPNGDTLLVEDLASTNGVALVPGGQYEQALPVAPGRPVAVRAGDIVQLGDFPLVAIAAAAGEAG